MGYGSNSLLSGLSETIFGDSSCSTALVNAGLRCLQIPFNFAGNRVDTAVCFVAGLVCGSVLTLVVLKTKGEPAAPVGTAPVNVNVSQRIGARDGGQSYYATRGSLFDSEAAESSAASLPSSSARSLRLRPLRRGTGTLA